MLIVLGIFLYAVIALLRGSDRPLAILIRTFVAASALFALYFDTQHDFTNYPSKFSIINQLGALFNNFVPQLQLFNLDRDIVVGIMEIALPLNFAVILDNWTRKRQVSIIFIITALLILFGLMSSSMRSLIVLGIVSMLALIIYMMRNLREHVYFSVKIWALISVTAILGIGILFSIVFGLSHFSFVQIEDSIVSHMDFNWRTWRLIQAYFFTGSGLGVYTMVLSAYSLLLHVPFVPHAENTFLQIWIEQGLLGFIAFVWLASAFYVWIWKRRKYLNSPAAVCALVATTAMLCHDLIDVSLYSTVWLPLMFVPFGLTVASTGYSRTRKSSKTWNRQQVTGAFLVIILGLVFGRNMIISAWYTNLGSIFQTRLELSHYKFPDKLVEHTRHKANYSKIEPYFRKALIFNPGNVSANQRLAMISLGREDYIGAAKLLATAYVRDPSDPVTLQLLGTAYLGSGRFKEAYTFWTRLPDAPEKLALEAWIKQTIYGDKERAQQTLELAAKISAERKIK